ncbi:uncharacterized protein LOC143462033 isoform X2 [Clavelina lepadiformis]|uniref:uncharacterized protein LOC143462033 isoform X2 n=1 Tax=Clavelina lepadiformis TaxID=159417 RepID=UPI00404265E2
MEAARGKMRCFQLSISRAQTSDINPLLIEDVFTGRPRINLKREQKNLVSHKDKKNDELTFNWFTQPTHYFTSLASD